MKLRNRIIWTFGHGLNPSQRFSGRHETILWFTKGETYSFNLDSVRVPQKYPGKKSYRGNKKGEYSGNPLGKNPTDVWDIPNVKANHVEKTEHPCQFPVAIPSRFIKALTLEDGVILDPYMGSGTTGVAAVLEGRKFIGAEIQENYYKIATDRIQQANDDNSCDLIFSNKEKGEEIYYIVQAKWFSKGKINNSNDISNIYKACLTDFNMMLEHKKEESKTNLKFNKMYKKLKKHVENNGKVRFLLVTLCVTTPDFRLKELDEYCASPLVKTEIYDLISIKNTYIDNNYRGYITNNPLQAIDTVNQDININIKKGHLQVNDSTYIFLLGAEEINRLYKMFGHRLFLKNVRNPLSVAANKAIEQSAKTDPDHFLGCWLRDFG